MSVSIGNTKVLPTLLKLNLTTIIVLSISVFIYKEADNVPLSEKKTSHGSSKANGVCQLSY